jgi:hypothetical protein
MGAMVGAIVSYLLFTERGRTLRRQLVPALDDLERELSHFRTTLTQTAGLASEGWKIINDIAGEARTPSMRTTNPHQTAPF